MVSSLTVLRAFSGKGPEDVCNRNGGYHEPDEIRDDRGERHGGNHAPGDIPPVYEPVSA